MDGLNVKDLKRTSSGRLALAICIVTLIIVAIDYAIGYASASSVAPASAAPKALVITPPPPAGTGCTVTFNSAGQAVVVCTSGLKMTCRP